MTTLSSSQLYNAAFSMILHCNRYLREDIRQSLVRACGQETSPLGQDILQQLLANADYAASSGLPLCQDCGVAVFFVELGEDVQITGEGLIATLNRATRDAYEQGCLRKSLCHPLTRKNTLDNTPAMIHVELVPGSQVHLRFMAKGGGSENMSQVTMLTPAQGWEGIKDFVLRQVTASGSNPCPPIIVGLGIGGTFDVAPVLAKKALFRSLEAAHPDASLAAHEQELLLAINQLGIGPMGLGGDTTCLGVKIEMLPCHIASLPVAINIQCHSARHALVIL